MSSINQYSSHLTKLVTLLISFSIAMTLNGQEISREFGDIRYTDLSATYPDDPDAEAIVLFDKGEAKFLDDSQHGFIIRFTRSKRIKIVSDAGSEFKNVTIPYYQEGDSREKVEYIKAYTYTPNEHGGFGVTELDPDAVFDERINKFYRQKKFAFPNAQAGSIVEYQYELYTPFKFNLPDWEFQSTIPTLYSKYEVDLIPFYEYIYSIQGGKPDVLTSNVKRGERQFSNLTYKEVNHTFIRYNIPSFDDEEFITAKEDFIAKIDFQLSKIHRPQGGTIDIMTTWPDMSKNLQKHQNFGTYIKKSSKIASKELLTNLQLKDKSESEKTELIINQIKQSLNWNRFRGIYANESAKTVWTSKEGSIAEINLMAIGALREAEINAEPIIISTRGHGKVNTDYPFVSYFNYVLILVEIDGVPTVIDATNENLPFSLLPPECYNGAGLVVKVEPGWISLTPKVNSMEYYFIEHEVSEESTVINIGTRMSNYSGYRMHNDFDQDYTDSKTSIASKWEKENDIVLQETELSGSDQDVTQYSIKANGSYATQTIQDKIILKPFLNFPVSENPFTQKKRLYPVDFVYKLSKEFMSTISIPEGYKVLHLPENLNIDNAQVTVKYSTFVSDNKINVTGGYSRKKAVYPAHEYDNLNYVYKQIIEKFNEELVLEKK